LVDGLAEVAARLDRSHIHKYRVIAETRRQLIEKTTSLAFGIVSSIVYEDRTQRKPPVFPA